MWLKNDFSFVWFSHPRVLKFDPPITFGIVIVTLPPKRKNLKQMKKLILYTFFALAGTFASYAQTPAPTQAENKNQADIKFEEEKFDFGNVKEGELAELGAGGAAVYVDGVEGVGGVGTVRVKDLIDALGGRKRGAGGGGEEVFPVGDFGHVGDWGARAGEEHELSGGFKVGDAAGGVAQVCGLGDVLIDE